MSINSIHPLLSMEHSTYQDKFDNITEEFDHKTCNNLNRFKITHNELVADWKETDYRYGLTSGQCQSCCNLFQSLHQPCDIVVQEGPFRYGIKWGICLPCIENSLVNRKVEWINIKLFFTNSPEMHEAAITVDKIQGILKREFPLDQPLTDIQKELLSYIVTSHKDDLEKAMKEKELPFQCKKCHKITLTSIENTLEKEEYALQKEIILDQIEWCNEARKANKIAGMCLGCSTPVTLIGGCSIGTCNTCISKTKTCMVCLNGATDQKHEIAKCSQIMSDMLDLKPNTFLASIKLCGCLN